MTNYLIRDPKISDTTEITDWVESIALIEGRKKVSRSKIRKYIQEIVVPDDNGEALDIQTELILEEINQRKRIAQEQYPFQLGGSGFYIENQNESTAYIFLLLLSTSSPFRSEKRQNEVESLLDYIVLDALKYYLSENSDGVHFGWPVTGDRPTNFSEAIKWLTQKMNLQPGIGKRNNYKKDSGVDVVVWNPFSDGRSSFITILAQCTVQDEWFDKTGDIKRDVWQGWVDVGKYPLTCLAIPFVIPKTYEKWDELRRSVNLILDRLRI